MKCSSNLQKEQFTASNIDPEAHDREERSPAAVDETADKSDPAGRAGEEARAELRRHVAEGEPLATLLGHHDFAPLKAKIDENLAERAADVDDASET